MQQHPSAAPDVPAVPLLGDRAWAARATALHVQRLSTLQVATVGDFGVDNSNELKVANMVHSWKPDDVLLLGGEHAAAGVW